MSRVTKRNAGWAVCALLTAALAVTAAGCGGGGGSKSSETTKSNLPSSIGPGEGALNLIEWPYYSDPAFAKKFEQQSGCKIHRKDAGSSNQMVSLMRAGGGGGGGQWDLVSASGDASLRLIRGGDVKEVNVDLIPSWKEFIPIFKSPAHNTVDGKHYGVSLQWGPNVLLYNTTKVKPGPTGWGALYDAKYKGQITVPNNPIQIADAAFYLMHSEPDLEIKDPYELNKKQFDATIALLKQQRKLVKLYWNYDTDGRSAFANGDVSLGAIWPVDTLALQAKKVPVKEIIPADGATGWAAIYSGKYKGKLTVPNNPIQIADAALYLQQTKPSLGIKDPYELTKDQLDAAVSLLKDQKPNLKRYWNYTTDEISSFKNGDVWMGAGWPYQTLQLQAAKAPVKEIVPLPTTGWADTWMLAKKAPHPNCAYLWMKYVTTPKPQAQQALIFGETPVNPKACPLMNEIQAGSCAKYHLNEPLDYYDTIKFWKTPIADCGNGKNDCMDYNAWQKAWTQVTG